jgi:hypothetical protein
MKPMEEDVERYGNEKNTEEPTGFHDERGVRASQEQMAWPDDITEGLGEFPPDAVSDDPNSHDPSLDPDLPGTGGRPVSADADTAGAGSAKGIAQGQVEGAIDGGIHG